jgi:hypothetical protein
MLNLEIELQKWNRQMLNDLKGNNSSSNSSSNFNLVADQVPMVMHHEKPLVDTSLPKKLIPERLPEVTISAIIPVIGQCHQTSLEDKETDAFLDEVHKKKIDNEIRQRKREKKLSHVYINFFEKMFENELCIKYMELLYGIYKNI